MPKKKVVAKKRKRSVKPKYAYTAKEALAYLKEFFSSSKQNYTENQKLWAVLSALRGPDNRAQDEKDATTAPIRFAVFGDDTLVRRHAWCVPDSLDKLIRRGKPFQSNHFADHAKEAFEALGLKWNELNQQEEQMKGN